MSPLTCYDVRPLLDDLALGLLESRKEEQVRAHLSQCASCRQSLDVSRALFSDLADGLAVSGPLPAGLGDGLASSLLGRLPDLPGDEDPLAGTSLARRRIWHRAGVTGGLMLTAVAGLWATLLLVLPESVEQALRLAALTLGRAAVNTSAGLFDAVLLILRGFWMVLRDLDPWTMAAAVFALVAVELAVASRSHHTRWDA
ncbi:MAG: zf-HC2 domain-containing protein [Bacillota bacterium]